MQISPEETTKGRFNGAVQFRPTRLEIWGPEGLEQREPSTIEAKVIRGDTGEVEELPLAQEPEPEPESEPESEPEQPNHN